MSAGFNTGQGLWAHPAVLALAFVAAAAFLLALVAWLQALRIAGTHEPFRQLGLRKWVMGMAVLPYMPDAAMPYVKRYMLGFGVFFAAILSIFGLVWFGLARES